MPAPNWRATCSSRSTTLVSAMNAARSSPVWSRSRPSSGTSASSAAPPASRIPRHASRRSHSSATTSASTRKPANQWVQIAAAAASAHRARRRDVAASRVAGERPHAQQPGQHEQAIGTRVERVPAEQRRDGEQRGGRERGASADEAPQRGVGDRHRRDDRQRGDGPHRGRAVAAGELRPGPGQQVEERRRRLARADAMPQLAERSRLHDVDGVRLVEPQRLRRPGMAVAGRRRPPSRARGAGRRDDRRDAPRRRAARCVRGRG